MYLPIPSLWCCQQLLVLFLAPDFPPPEQECNGAPENAQPLHRLSYILISPIFDADNHSL